jgi:hypothetical protein
MRRGLDHGRVVGEGVAAAAEVLHERVPAAMVRADAKRLSPRIGRSLALSRPWSASITLLAYWSLTRRAAGTSSASN